MLIHTCCADCFLKLHQSLSEETQAAVQIFFYNPNIYPREEHQARLLAIKKVVKSLNQDIKIIVANYQPQDYFQTIKKLKDNIENRDGSKNGEGLKNRDGSKNRENCENKSANDRFTIISRQKRCPLCWELRLRALFEKAKAEKISLISSTLFSSNYQDLDQVKLIAQKLSREYKIDFYVPQIDQAMRDHSHRGFYKQNYCGCLYSLLEKSREKYDV